MNVSPSRDIMAVGGPYRPEPGPQDRSSLLPEIELRNVLGLLRRQAKLILLVAAIIVAVGAVVTFSMTPVFRASVLILVDTSNKNILDPVTQATSPAADSARVDSEVEILKADSVLMDVISAQNLVADSEFGTKSGWREKVMTFLRPTPAKQPTDEAANLAAVRNRLAKALRVERRGMTYLISVDIQSTSPDKAARLANTVAQTYIDRQVEAKSTSVMQRRNAIRNQIEGSRASVIQAETQVKSYIGDNLDRLVELSGRTELMQMRDALLGLTSQRDQAASQIDVLRQGLAGAQYEALASALQSEAAGKLEKQRQTLLLSLEVPESGSPASIKLEQALAKVQASLGEAATFRLAELETAVTTGRSEMERTRRELSAAIFKTELPADVLAQIYELQQTSQNATATYQALLSRLHNLETQTALQIADSRVVSPALAPTEPSFPRIPLTLGGISILALAIGIGVGFVFENFVGGFTSGDQVEAATRQPLTAALPRQRMEANSPSVADTMVTQPLARYSENVRRLRTSLDRSLSVERGRDAEGKAAVVLVSSALPGEGKTTVALSLARTYALAGQKVLIVDGDLRKPSLHKHLQLEPSTSLVDFLTGALPREEFRKVVVTDRKTSLTAVLGARRSDVPTDQLLTKASFSELLAVAGRMFDYIIIDSPPIEAVVDGLYLAGYADAIVFVVQWAKTPQRTALHALKSLRATMTANADIHIVMNQETARSDAAQPRYSGYYSN